MADNFAYNRHWVLTIDDLPDDVLLEIFDFYVIRYQDLILLEYDTKREIESWQSLVHVSRRWRCLVFGSPLRLKLQLFCIPGRSARKSLDIWPTLPLLIKGDITITSVDDIVTVLKHSDRICQINLEFWIYAPIKNFWIATQVPFPELVVLCLWDMSCGPVIPDSFLGGSVPRLQFLKLSSIPFPGLPNLLLSATRLAVLSLCNIPRSGYISPEAMATCLSMLTSLVTLQLEFEYPQSSPHHENRRSLPPTRSVLPSLKHFLFKGANEYLEDLLSQVDAPHVYRLSTTFVEDIHFDTPELDQFISRTPTFGEYNEARLIFHDHEALVRFQSHLETMVEVTNVFPVSHLRLSSLAQICTFLLRPLLTMENLYIYENPHLPPYWMDDIKNIEWSDLLLPFTAVKNLYLSKQFSLCMALALQEHTEGRTTLLLPALQNVFLEEFPPSEPDQEGIAQFTSARQLTNHPVAISVWPRDVMRDQR